MYPPAAPSPLTTPVSPAPEPPALTLTRDQVGEWWRRIELARARRKRESDKWNALLKAYLPPESNAADDINSNIHFRNVELKRAELWAQLPELMLTPLEPLLGIVDPTGQALDASTVVAVKRAVLNKLLGRDGANVKRTIDESLFAIFSSTGVGATKICYEVDTQDVEQPMPGPEQAMPGAVLNLQPVTSQTMQAVPVPVYERFRWYHFSEAKLLIPHDYHSTDFDESPWLGMEFVMPLAKGIKKYKLDPEFVANTSRDDLILEAGQHKDADAGSKSLLKGVEIWLKASNFDETVAHSQLYYVLTLIEGVPDRAAEYRPSPYQTIGPDHRLTADSMIGNPIHPITLRYLSDSAYIPADAAFTDPLVKQINTWRAQSIKGRDANIPRFFHPVSISAAVDKLKMADVGQGVAVPDEEFQKFKQELILAIPKLERAESDIQGESTIRRDNDETLGIGSNQAGAVTNTVRSATESAIVQQNVGVRLKAEQTQLMEAFLMGVRKFDALVQRYADQTEYVEIVGQDGAKKLAAWNQHTVSGRYAYDAEPDTQLTMDRQARIKNVLDFVNFMAKSQYMNQAEIARVVTLLFGFDPSRMIIQPQPPPPEKPKITMSFAFTAPDLSVPEVRQLLQEESGLQLGPVSPELQQAAAQAALKNAPHGGAADHVDQISKHTSDLTGKMDGRAPANTPQAAGVM